MSFCCVCTRSDAAVGALCAACAARLATGQLRAPGIITARHDRKSAAAWLVDAWGQLHPVTNPCRVGRVVEGNDIVIADLLVSAQHAELSLADHEWSVVDRGSANGTGVGEHRASARGVLPARAVVWFGDISFYFFPGPTPPASDVAPAQVGTWVPAPAAFSITSKPGHGELSIRAAAGHPVARAPGELVFYAGDGEVKRAALARLQFQLLRILCEAALDARANRSPFVPTQKLLEGLPFNTGKPEANHVRQVVAGLRAALERIGVPGGAAAGEGGIVRAAERFGYRIAWDVKRLPAKAR